ncbi:hypothetical protein KSF_081200 [Reticulibacter mediterranei]|uniref:Uncharacterized protein n=1 Tax=Reticulibacter mediterranei TaxID=2778369 RepID=A0A8J3N8B0_9CHLR|nr:hypothetical protein [Reticulibacter mediterranei]GHO98072.1 hypothetical protein KSF_081200 [Reticulibacter mediterranei]
MPKETKRFINPLLRPSSNVEVEETKSEPVQKQSESQVASTKATTDTSTATSAEVSVPPIREAVPLPPTTPKAAPVLPEAQVLEPEPQTSRHSAYPSTETSTYRTEKAGQRKSQVNEPSAEIQEISDIGEREDATMYSPPTSVEYANNTVPGSEPGFSAGHSPTFPSSATVVPSPVSSISPLHTASYSDERVPSQASEETTFVSPLPQTSTYTYGEQKRSSIQQGYDELVEQEYYTPPPVRRRRGAQSFEKTHERITVWVDKRLKQAFEELAYTEETSKTALLNEALADLLRKHSSR